MAGEENKIYKLLTYALNEGSVFLPEEEFANELVQDCLKLYSCDYVCTTVDNTNGVLCSTYPIQIIIPTHQKVNPNTKNGTNNFEDSDITDLIQRGRFARTRGRFPAPVILVAGKYICRSSTLARSPEIYGRTSYQYFTSSGPNENEGLDNGSSKNHPQNGFNKQLPKSNGKSWKYQASDESLESKSINGKDKPLDGNGQNKEWLLDKMRNTDIDLLHYLQVNVICDFMVEKKKVKFGMNVTSSEKVDRQQRYSDFGLISIPYPGCEFFADYKQNNYTGIGLKFDWTQQFVDAKLQVPEKMPNLPGVQWNNYVDWDLVKLTQNYLKLLLNCIAKPCSSGMLLHCISGWDRTPLFVSLLRLSLWADGIIHQSLNEEEIVYLTLAYDWLLFSHQFADRIEKNEEILHFCFDFLKYISSADFSLLPHLNSPDLLISENGNSLDNIFDLEEYVENLNNINDNSTAVGNNLDARLLNSNVQEVEYCLRDLVDQVSISDQMCYDVKNKNVLSDSETDTTNCSSFHQLNCSNHLDKTDNNASIVENGTVLETRISSALSTSLDTAKNHLNQHIVGHETKTHSFPPSKQTSEPISVPKSTISSQSLDCLQDIVSNGGSSTNTGYAEPGSSWQLISSVPFPQQPNESDNAEGNSRKSSMSSLTETDFFKVKLSRRKERLALAANVMIPAYCAAVQKRRQEGKASTLSTMLGNFAHFIKRT